MASMASTRHPRSRTGCWICRLRKKKCDEARPTCQQCRNLKIQCDGYGIAQPTWMRDPVAAKRKKEEIKLQIGKRGRRRRKARSRISEELESGAKGNQGVEAQKEDKGSPRDGSVTKAVMKTDDAEGTTCENNNGKEFVFEITENGIQLLKPFLETPEIYPSGAVAMLDSPDPPMGCYRCPIKNSLAKSINLAPGYGIVDTRTGKPLLQDVKSGVILAPKLLPLWKPNNLTVPNTRTKEEEIANGEYDAIIASLVSLATPKHRVSLSPAELSDPSLVPPISFGNTHESILMRHYIRNLFRLTYSGMSEPRIRKSLREVLVPLINVNPGLLKACLSSSAMHLAAAERKSEAHAKALIRDAWAYRVDCVRDLKQRLKDGGASEESLASILALTSFEIYSSLSNWKHHLQAAIECLVQLDLLNRPAHSASSKFLMSRVIWMDILSSLTLGRAPQLWANYREILSRPVHERAYYGLLEIMGCDDTVMFLVSEVMCVEDYKYRTLKDGMISWARGCKRATELDVRLRDRDLPIAMKLPPSPEPPSLPLPPSHEDDDEDENDPTGLVSSPLSIPSPSSTASSSHSPESAADGDNAHTPHYSFSQPSSPLHAATPASSITTAENAILSTSEEHILSGPNSFDENSVPPELPVDQDMIIKATTAAFRTATRIHLWSIGLGFYPRLNFFQQLLEELIVMVALIPTKSSRVVTWPLLVGGCMATEEKDREFFAGRCAIAHGGSLGGIGRIMREVWRRRDETDRTMGVGCGQEVHWRNVMREEGLEILLV